MAFIDILAMQLFALGFSGLVLLYMTVATYLSYRRGDHGLEHITSGQIPLAALGFYAVVTGLWGQFVWPLPGSYNILFYDIYPLWGMFLIGAAWGLHSKLKLQYTGFFALLIGCASIIYGFYGYNLGLTSAPLALLALYTLFGIGGILGYPMTLMVDRAEEKIKNRSVVWKIMLAGFILSILLGSLLALFIGINAIPAHLASAP